MKVTELLRLQFKNSDGSANATFTGVWFPVKSIVVTNCFYQSPTAATVPIAVVGILGDFAGHNQVLGLVALNASGGNTFTTLEFQNPIDITGNHKFYVSYNGVLTPTDPADVCLMTIEFNG